MTWGNTDDAANSVSYAPSQAGKTSNTGNQTALFGNTTVGTFEAGKATGQFGVSTAEMANTGGEAQKVTHAGWVLRNAGTGSIESIVVSVGGTTYNNTDVISITSDTANAAATLTTNATGGITSVTITNAGAGFVAVNPTVLIANSTAGATGGSGATLVATAGGRAGRVNYETLVAMGSITGDASDDALLPE